MESDDSSLYLIKSDVILEKYDEDLAEEEKDLLEDENIMLRSDTLIMLDMNLSFSVTRRNDSVFGFIEIYDTIFSMDRGDCLRKLKKDYFLNIQGDTLWMVFKLSFDRPGHIFLLGIDYEEEIEIFKKYSLVETKTNKEGEPVKYILSPTRRELGRLIKLETFTDTTEYYRISQDSPR